MTDGIRVEHPSTTTTRIILACPEVRDPQDIRLLDALHDAYTDVQSQPGTVQAGFSLHRLGHAHNGEVHGKQIETAGLRMIRQST